MDRLWAIKQDFDPFPARFLINYNVLAIFRCSVYRCPYCRSIFKVIWGLKTALIGEGERTCWKCHNKFSDGSQEWPEMSSDARMLFFLPISVAGWLAGTLIILGIILFALYRNGGDSIENLWLLAMLIAPLILWLIYRSVQIARSVRRFNMRGSQKAA
ncbi:MAG: hypothetical protein WCE61_07010 [Candidatus Acidiferrum sp.]